MAHTTKSSILPIIDQDVIVSVYDARKRPSLAEKWSEFEANDAPLARRALEKANQLGTIDPRMRAAYLEGIADHRAALYRQVLLNGFSTQSINPNDFL